MLKNILLQFPDLSNMTCVYYRVEDKLSASTKTTPSCFQKKLRLCFYIWTFMTWPRISESTFPSKVSSHNSWKTAQLSKMVCNNVPLTVQRFEHNALLPEFPGPVSFPNLLETPSLFREYLIFFQWFLNQRLYDKFIQYKSCVKSTCHCFYCFNGFTDSEPQSVTMAMCQKSMWLNLVYIFKKRNI